MLFCLAAIVRAEDVPTEPPPLYTAQLAPLLTPTATLLALPLALGNDQPANAVLLDEHLQYVETDGRRLTVIHVAYKALTEAGAKNTADDIFSYRKKEQKFYLVQAETIQPDGTVQAVRPSAVLLQSPQRQAQFALYDDQMEVHVIYPNVKPGSVTHTIVVIEDLSAKMPDEYAQSFVWGRTWPTGRERISVNLPATLAGRLQLNPLGPGVPAPMDETLPEGRVRLGWNLERLLPEAYEPNPAPHSQTGPAIHLTTLKDWAQVGQWFNTLSQGRDVLKPALAAQVDAWTKEAKGRDDLIRILYTHASDDVRYTGLEFGAADYQPHDCNEVWENQYGDCKDKATLLAAFLRHKGVAANVVLLNTDHAGLVDRRSPDFRVFTHAIVALPDGHGGWQFCDPTLEHARPGLLSPSDADRDVLVVTAGGAEWAHTPVQSAGRMDYALDLKLSPAGELSGWLTVTAGGYYASSQSARFAKLNPDETRGSLTRIVRGFYAGAQVMDVVQPAATAADTHILKAYFIVTQQRQGGDGVSALVFPQGPGLFYDVGHAPERSSTYFIWADHTSLHATVALPPGLGPTRLPEDYQLNSPAFSATAQWQTAPGICRMELELDQPRALLTPAEFPVFYNATQSLQAWLGRPVPLAAGPQSIAPSIAATPAAELDLPLMPTGEGEINLVDARYPPEGNHALRRAALLKTLQYFPNDKSTVFDAQVALAYLDWYEDKDQAAVDRLRPVLASSQTDVSPETFAWGESILALALTDAGQKDEAIAIFRRLATTPGLSDDRHARSALSASNLLHAKSPADAVPLLTAAAPLRSDSRDALYALLARVLLQLDKASELRTRLTELQTAQPTAFEAVLAHIVQQSESWHEPGEDNRQPALFALVADLVPAPGKELKTALTEAATQQQIAQVAGQIQIRLKTQLAAPPLSGWAARPPVPELKTQEEFDRAIKVAHDQNDAEQCLQLAVLALVSLPPAKDFPERLWRAAGYADWKERIAGRVLDEPIFSALLDLCELLPHNNSYYFEGAATRAAQRGRKGDDAGQQAVYQAMLADPQFPENFQVIHGRLGDSLLRSGDLPGALRHFREMEKYLTTFPEYADYVLEAVFINLQRDQTDEALRLIGLFAKTDDAGLKKFACEKQIRELIALAATGKAAEFWAARKSWWPQWETLARDLALPAPGPETIAPIIPSLTALGTAAGQAIRANDRTEYFQTVRRLAAAARWQPSLAVELASLNLDPFPQIPPEQKSAWRHLVIAVLTLAAPETTEQTRRRQVMLAATDLADNQPAESLRIAALFRALPAAADAFTRAMNRVRGFAALAAKQEQPESAEALAQDLADASATDHRAMTVDLLCDLDHALGRPADEEALLHRELANPIIAGDKAEAAKITARLEALAGPARFAKAATAWVAAHRPAWYEYAEPTSLADPRLRNLDAVLKSPEQQFKPVEIVKLRLLVAQDPAQSPENQRDAWHLATRALLTFCPTRTEAAALVASLLEDRDFDDEAHTIVLWDALFEAYSALDRADFARMQQLPDYAKLSDWDRQRMQVLADYLATDPTSKDALIALAQKLTAKPLIGMGIEVMINVTKNLLQLGEVGAAHDLATQAATWQLTPDVTTPHQTIQLELARTIRPTEVLLPTQQALIQRVVQTYQTLPDVPPAEFAVFQNQSVPLQLDPAVELQTCLWMIKTRQFNQDNLSFWVQFCHLSHVRTEDRTLAGDLARLVVEQAKDDSARADAVAFCKRALDIDDPAVRTLLATLFAKIRQPVEAPLTTAAIRLYEIEVAIRTGQPLDLTTVFANLNHPDAATERTYIELKQSLQVHDLPALKHLTDTLPSDQLLQPRLLKFTLPAFELLGLKDEAQLSRETARHLLHDLILRTWATRDDQAVSSVFQLAQLLGEPSLLPPAWIKFITDPAQLPAGRLQILWLDAMQRKDWPAAITQADALVKLDPTLYDYYWLQAQALWSAGRKAEAVTPLTTYTRYSKDQVDYPRAVAWLKELGKPVP